MRKAKKSRSKQADDIIAKTVEVSHSAQRIKRTTILISTFALLISVGSLWLSLQTFYIEQRPYIGIVEQNYELLGDPPAAMAWSFNISNVGNRPAWINVVENRTTVIRNGKFTDLPMLDKPNGGIYLMPGQKASLGGQFDEATSDLTVRELFSGVVTLRCTIRLSYSTKGLFFCKRRFTYMAVMQFRHYVIPQNFYMIEGSGN